MAQNISLMGASYPDVPAVVLPKTGGGTAKFSDTSDATATADKILQGYTAYGADGTKLTGTATASVEAIVVTEEQDSHGGTIKHISGVNISDSTIDANKVLSGEVAYTANGTRVVGTAEKEEEDLPLKDVVFIDYDGKIVYQYTQNEFMALTAMPSNPSHTGLIAQGWNWTLADAQDYVAKYEALVIGQNYTTDDGKTRIYFTVDDWNFGFAVHLRFYTSVKGGVTVDWDDGTTSISTANADTTNNLTHTYTQKGDYVIKMWATSGTYSLGYNGANNGLMGQISRDDAGCAQNRTLVSKIEIGNNVNRLHRQVFQGMRNLKSVSIPTTTTYIYSGTSGSIFDGDDALRGIVFPSGVDTLYGNTFQDCVNIRFISFPKSFITTGGTFLSSGMLINLRMVTFPERSTNYPNPTCYNTMRLERFIAPGTYTSIPQSFCRANNFLTKITIPATVTSIADYAMDQLRNIREIHMLPTSPPSLVNTRGLGMAGWPQCTIYVPYSSDHSILTAYQSATNWSSFSERMQEEPIRSITASFNAGNNTIYTTDTLRALKQYLTVTAHYDANSTDTIIGYDLVGTLEAGTNTITVKYMNYETTFTVTAVEGD